MSHPSNGAPMPPQDTKPPSSQHPPGSQQYLRAMLLMGKEAAAKAMDESSRQDQAAPGSHPQGKGPNRDESASRDVKMGSQKEGVAS